MPKISIAGNKTQSLVLKFQSLVTRIYHWVRVRVRVRVLPLTIDIFGTNGSPYVTSTHNRALIAYLTCCTQ